MLMEDGRGVSGGQSAGARAEIDERQALRGDAAIADARLRGRARRGAASSKVAGTETDTTMDIAITAKRSACAG